MTAAEQRWKQSKAIIANACLMLRHTRETAFAFSWCLSEPASEQAPSRRPNPSPLASAQPSFGPGEIC